MKKRLIIIGHFNDAFFCLLLINLLNYLNESYTAKTNSFLYLNILKLIVQIIFIEIMPLLLLLMNYHLSSPPIDDPIFLFAPSSITQ